MAEEKPVELEDNHEESREHAGAFEQPNRIFRSRADRYLAGVCGGFAEYFQVDPLLVRIIWFTSIFVNGVGFLAYIAAWIIVPENPHAASRAVTAAPERSRKVGLALGIFLIFIGLLFLSDNLQYQFMMIPWRFRNFDMGILIALLVIGLGAFLILKKSQNSSESATMAGGAFDTQASKKLMRSVIDRKIAGVCGGLARYFDIDPALARIGFVVLGAVQPLLVILSYIVMMIVLPEDTEESIVG
jgi:phage shock protein PspC (stress-responsive transcriptional regulator)